MPRFFKQSVFLAVISLLVYFELTKWNWRFLGLAILLIYIFWTGKSASAALAKFFDFSDSFRVKILGAFLSVANFGWMCGAVLFFYKFSPAMIAVIFFLNGMVFSFFETRARSAKKIFKEEKTSDVLLHEKTRWRCGFLILPYLVLVFCGFYFLWQSRTGNAIFSPWQIINSSYVYIFFFATLFLGILIFSNFKTRTLILLLCLHSLLLVSYLPITHKLFYGADGWRHVAVESQIIANGSADVVLYGGSGSFMQSLNPGRLSYGQLWGISAVFANLGEIDLIKFNAWFLPFVWALVFPILLFELGITFGWGRKESLFFAWFGFLPFALQAAGAFTLPANFGFLIWLLLLIMLLRRARNKKSEQAILLVYFGVASVFGYGLYFILFWFGWAAIEIKQNFKIKNIAFLIFLFFLIPAIEYLVGYDFFDANINLFAQIKQTVGNFIGFFLASGPRPHDILTGNIIFNQVPSYAFISNIFTRLLWWIPIFMILFLSSAFVGLIKVFQEKKFWLAAMSALTGGGYIVSRYFLSGENVLARRLDAAFALLLLILFFEIFRKILARIGNSKIILFGLILIFSIAITTSYSLGPDTNAASVNEYKAMEYVWSQEKNFNKFCALADTYPLLALEELSAKKIVGGGFPINEYFAQPERVELFKAMNENSNEEILKSALRLTGASACYYVAHGDSFKYNDYALQNSEDFKLFGDMIVWKFGL
ncbi:MAG: hypothetical protein WC459_05135 [Patescibacteria group bacterium]